MAETTPPDRKRAGRKGNKLLLKLRSKYRLVMIDDRTFEERFSMRLNRLNVLLVAIGAFTVHGLFVTAVIVLTPLKRYIPGYADQETKLNAYRSTLKADSLEVELHVRDLYLANLRAVLRGELPADSASLSAPVTVVPAPADLVPGRADSVLRSRIAREEAYELQESKAPVGGRELAGMFFFPPLQGVVTSTFDRAQKHFGIDIVAKADAAVKACQAGTVVFAGWTTNEGHVLQLQHANDLVSVYKHNSVLLKQVGDRVKAGEAIAIVGNSGELTTGPHLHLELWYKGDPVDPQTYMVFK
jgi:murein DD-endopeptidase MepM/ murein hydrolase activator NlpD